MSNSLSVKIKHPFKSQALQTLISIPQLLCINLFCTSILFQAIQSTQDTDHATAMLSVLTFSKIRELAVRAVNKCSTSIRHF